MGRQVLGTFKFEVVCVTDRKDGDKRYYLKSTGRYRNYLGLGSMVEVSAYVQEQNCSYGGDEYWSDICYHKQSDAMKALEQLKASLADPRLRSRFKIETVAS